MYVRPFSNFCGTLSGSWLNNDYVHTLHVFHVDIRVVIPNSNNTELWRTFSSSELSGSNTTASSITLSDSLVPPNDTDCAIISGAIKGINHIYRRVKITVDNSTSQPFESPPAKLSGLWYVWFVYITCVLCVVCYAYCLCFILIVGQDCFLFGILCVNCTA